MKKQCEMQPYRAATEADSADIPTDTEKAAYLLNTFPFDGMRFNYVFMCDGDASATIEVWFWDKRNETWTPDEELKQVLGDKGSGTFRIETNSRPMLLKISALELPEPDGDVPHLLITQGAYSDSRL